MLDLLFLHLIAYVSTIIALIRAIYISCSFLKKNSIIFLKYAKILSLLISKNKKEEN